MEEDEQENDLVQVEATVEDKVATSNGASATPLQINMDPSQVVSSTTQDAP